MIVIKTRQPDFAEERARCEALRAAADPAEYERIHYFNAV